MKKYPKSLRCYSHICDEILSWMEEWISQHEFDDLSFSSDIWEKKLIYYTPEACVLHPDNENLHLLKLLVLKELVESKQVNGTVFYRKITRR